MYFVSKISYTENLDEKYLKIIIIFIRNKFSLNGSKQIFL